MKTFCTTRQDWYITYQYISSFQTIKPKKCVLPKQLYARVGREPIYNGAAETCLKDDYNRQFCKEGFTYVYNITGNILHDNW